MKLIIETISNIQKHPVKSAVTFLSVGVGVGILIFALSLSIRFSQLMDDKINATGQVLTVSNSELQADGTYDRVRPAELDSNAVEIVANSVSGIESSAILSPGLFNEMSINGNKYQVRNSIGSSEQYLKVMDLELLSGVAMTATDVEKNQKKMWLSESTAIELFGSADQAIEQQVQLPAIQFGPPGARRESRAGVNIFEVAGVYEDADELKRQAYGIADVLVPYTSMVPNTGNAQRLIDMLSSTFIVNVVNNANAEAAIYDVLALEYGLDISLNVWEGTLGAPSSLLQETRDSISQLSFIINLLGFILLISGAIGILSIMMVEIIGKNKEISLERALGASIPAIVRKFMMQAFVLSGISAVIGVALAYLFAIPMIKTVMIIFDGIDLTDLESGIIHPVAIIVGTVSALLFGGLFGVLPLASIVKLPIAEGLRDA